ncbi:hypothetical protein [Nonomuraea sp. NPDC050643]|uniref:hypothetical protein n=1 Tax=Nonomuraea sp. NPDC050643 TaxID=3155660 RepID=UPI0033E27EAD
MAVTRRAFLAAAALTPVLVSTPAFAVRDPYAFPVRPGTKEWAAMKTHAERIRALQFPDGMAASMSTDDLVSTVLDYPLLHEALWFSSVQQGVEAVAARFNGLAELLRRPDAGPALLSRYAALDARPPKDGDALAKGSHVLAAWAVETLLAQPQALATLSADETESALRTAHRTYVTKSTEPAYGPAGLEPTATLLGRALATREGWTWDHLRLLREATASTTAEAEAVVRAVERHFAEPGRTHRVRTPATTLDHLGTVYTPKGTPVTVEVRDIELSPGTILHYNALVAAAHPGATRETDSTRKYNCHAYAWYSTSPFGNVWMNRPNHHAYWLDGSFLEWTFGVGLRPNMRWRWVNDDHSGIEVESTTMIVSKWGQGPRMRHWWDDTPYNDSLIYRYYRNW